VDCRERHQQGEKAGGADEEKEQREEMPIDLAY
jgi:hypothetical protein